MPLERDSLLKTPFMFDHLNQNVPVALEFERYACVSKEHFKDSLPFLEAMRRTQATFAGFHGYLRPWLDRGEIYFTEYCVNRLGYWYFVNGVEICELKIGVKNYLSLYIETEALLKHTINTF